jgi:hypothetical protein
MRLAKLTSILVIALGAIHTPAVAEKTEGGTGLAYGVDHAYFLTAPRGWILDTESGASQGVFAVFYPRGSSWDGPVVMYSNAADREGRSPDAAVKHDIQAMRENNPKLKVADGENLATKDKKQALIRYFTGDSYGNCEAAGYVVEKNIVVNMILTARNKTEFDSAMPAFRALVGSYRFVSDDPAKLDLAALAKAEKQRTSMGSASVKKNNIPLQEQAKH